MTTSTTTCRHSPCFSSVLWYGHSFTFTKTQALIVGILWQAMLDGIPTVRDGVLLDQSGSMAVRLRDVFKRKGKMHSAWGTLIVPGEVRGSRRLATEENFPNPENPHIRTQTQNVRSVK